MAVLTACGSKSGPSGEPLLPTATQLGASASPTPQPTQTLVPTPLPPRVLTVCLGREPSSLFLYAANSQSARSVLEAVYDGPFDTQGYLPFSVILQSVPTLANAPLDIEDAEARYGRSLAVPQTPETIYEKQWALTVLEKIMTRLEEEMARSRHAQHFPRLKPFLTLEGGDASYRDLARELGLSEPSIKVAIHRMRRRFGALLREEVSHTMDDPSPSDVDDELRYLFSVMGS